MRQRLELLSTNLQNLQSTYRDAEQKYQANLKYYRLQVENSLGLMCTHDMDGVLLFINPAAAQSLGYRPEEGVGRNLREFLAPAVRHLFDAYLERIRRDTSVRGVMRLQARDGTERFWMYRNVRHAEPGQPPTVLGHAIDITERIRLERELRQARKELAVRVAEKTADLQRTNERLRAEIGHRQQMEEELLKAKKMESIGLLAGGIAHDFNNLLAIIGGNLALARLHTQPEDAIRPVLDQIDEACARAAKLTAQLLTFAKGGAPLRQATSLPAIIERTASLLFQGTNIHCEISADPELWLADTDAIQMGQVFQNLLLNAQQAMPGGGEVRVRAENAVVAEDNRALVPGPYVKVTVTDNGCGIAPENLSRIFDPYFSTKDAHRGLGLATVYSIVSRHQGSITVESQSGKGSTFCIYLPASREMQPAAAERAEDSLGGGRGRVLVMDDEAAIRQLTLQILGRMGYTVECAADGAQAVALYQQNLKAGTAFDCVLLDLTVLGGMSGKEAMERLREIDPDVRAIVSSGYSDDPVMSNYQAHGFCAVVPKPWDLSQLAETLEQVIARTRA